MPGFSTSDPELLDPGPTFDVSGEELDPAQRGYTLVHNYAHYFWRPYLGNTAFALWELLMSFCYGDHDTAFPSISRLARMLTNSDHCRAVVTGRPSPRPSPPKTRGEGAAPPLPIISGPLASRSEAETRERVGVRGALSVLRRERLVQVMQRGQGPTLHYTFRVLKSLPLLSPEQVQQLCPGLQRDHAAWLERYGIDAPTYLSAYASEDDIAAHGFQSAPAADNSSTPEPSNDSAAASSQAGGSRRSTKNPYSESDPMKKLRQALLSELCMQYPGSEMRSQFGRTKFEGVQDGVLSVRVFNACRYDFLQHRLARIVGRVLSEVTHCQVHAARFVLDESVSEKARDQKALLGAQDADADQPGTNPVSNAGSRNPFSDRERVSGTDGRVHADADGNA